MLLTNRHLPRLLGFSAAIAALVLGSSDAHAQFGVGMGLGGGMGMGFGFHQVPSPTGYLNQQALAAANRPREGVPSRTPYANNPNSYINRLRDPGFASTYDVRQRRPPSYRPRPVSASTANRSQPQSQRGELLAGNPILPLASFFDASQKLIWPSESPTAGELQEKRNVSDEATLAVFVETKRQITASVSSAAFARQKLLDYGRPALEVIRSKATPAISDAFHMFLLSLYDSLAQSAEPPQPPRIPPAPPPP
jgi:hypothetical protein